MNAKRLMVCAALAMFLGAGTANAGPVSLIGDWSQDFSTEYTFGNLIDPGTIGWSNTHPLWETAVGHPDGPVLYANSFDDEASSKVWEKIFDAPADTQLTFTAWVANVCCTLASGLNYPGSRLEFWLNNSLFFEAQTDGAGVMEQQSASFWTGNGGPFTVSLRNQSMCYNGCDFAMAAAAVNESPVPETATVGLLATGLVAVWRRRRKMKNQR